MSAAAAMDEPPAVPKSEEELEREGLMTAIEDGANEVGASSLWLHGHLHVIRLIAGHVLPWLPVGPARNALFAFRAVSPLGGVLVPPACWCSSLHVTPRPSGGALAPPPPPFSLSVYLCVFLCVTFSSSVFVD